MRGTKLPLPTQPGTGGNFRPEYPGVFSSTRRRVLEGVSLHKGLRIKGIYDWFTEGFDTADLQEAKALLAELGC